MDKVLITNCYRDYGFLFTTLFLEEGYEVIGLKSRELEDSNERKLEIGRNSNFSEMEDIDDLSFFQEGEQYLLILNEYEESTEESLWARLPQSQRLSNCQILVVRPIDNNFAWQNHVPVRIEGPIRHTTPISYFYLPKEFAVKDEDKREVAEAILNLAKVNW